MIFSPSSWWATQNDGLTGLTLTANFVPVAAVLAVQEVKCSNTVRNRERAIGPSRLFKKLVQKKIGVRD